LARFWIRNFQNTLLLLVLMKNSLNF